MTVPLQKTPTQVPGLPSVHQRATRDFRITSRATMPSIKPSLPENAETKSSLMLLLSRLASGMPGISPVYGRSLAEAAAVCLQESGHAPGVELPVGGSFQARFELLWDEVTDQSRRTWADPEVATEHGACAVAALLMEELTGLKIVERSRKGLGFDYWLGKDSAEPMLFQATARLEVSGVRQSSWGEVGRRVRQKVKQTRVSDGLLDAFVVVVEFGHPQAQVVKR